MSLLRWVMVAVLAWVAGTAHARRDRTLSGDVIKAARLLVTARLGEAEAIVRELENRAPNSAEVRWLRAELEFHNGDYTRSATTLASLRDDVMEGMVGATKKLVASTLSVTKSFVETVSPQRRFAIRYAPGPDAAIAEVAGEVLDKTWHALNEDLGIAPQEIIRVEILSDPSDLAKLSTLSVAEIETTGTIALAKYNKIMVVSPRATLFGYPWMDTLAHEYTHLIVSRLSHDSAPVWMQEGIARLEQTRWRRPPEVVLTQSEHALLHNAVRKRRLIAFDDMHPSMAKLPSQDAAELAYAQVYTLIGWMHSKVGYKGMRDALTAQRDGKTARRAIADATGVTWPDVEKQWRAQLKVGDSKARKGRPIRFKRRGADSENIGLGAVPARARKFARLAGMLRAHGQLESSVVEYEKALAAAGPDPFVIGKLARTMVELGRYDRAIELAMPLSTDDEHDPVAALTLGIAYSARQAWPEAAAAYERALRTSPFDRQTRCGLAEAYDKIQDARANRERAACALLKNE